MRLLTYRHTLAHARTHPHIYTHVRSPLQRGALSKRAATLVTGLLPALGTGGVQSGREGASGPGSQTRLHAASSSPEVAQQVCGGFAGSGVGA